MKFVVHRYDGKSVEVEPHVVVAGIDFGFTEPFVIEVGIRVGTVWLNIHEVYRERLSIGEVLKVTLNVATRFGVSRFWADSENPQMIEYLQTHNIPVLPNQIKNLEYGVQTVYSLMKARVDHPLLGPGPKFRVDKKACPNLVREATQYGRAVVRGEVVGRIKNENDHAWSAVRYYITGEGEVPPEVYAPEQVHRPGLYVKNGVWYDDPVGRQLVMSRKKRTVVEDPWWDEQGTSVLDVDEVQVEDW